MADAISNITTALDLAAFTMTPYSCFKLSSRKVTIATNRA